MYLGNNFFFFFSLSMDDLHLPAPSLSLSPITSLPAITTTTAAAAAIAVAVAARPRLEPSDQLPLADLQRRAHLVEAVRAVQKARQQPVPVFSRPFARFARSPSLTSFLGSFLGSFARLARCACLARCARLTRFLAHFLARLARCARCASCAGVVGDCARDGFVFAGGEFLGGGCAGAGGRGGDGVFVDAVQEAFDDAEDDEAAHVDAVEGGGVLDAKVAHAQPLLEAAVQLHQLGAADQRARVVAAQQRRAHHAVAVVAGVVAVRVVGHGDVAGAFVLQLRALHEAGQLGRGRVDGAEAEDVQQEDAVVVEQVADRLAHQLVVGVGGQGDLRHAVDAVDVREDEQHSEVPVGVHQRRQPHRAERHMMREQRRRRRVGGEELDVERVVVIDRDHRFAVVVQVLEQDLAQGVDLARVGRRDIAAEEARLLLERAQQRRELERHRQVRRELGGAVEHEAEIEEELVARVERRRQADRVPEDPVRVGHDGDDARAELLPRNDVRRNVREVEKRDLRRCCRRDNRVGWHLMEHFGAFAIMDGLGKWLVSGDQ